MNMNGSNSPHFMAFQERIIRKNNLKNRSIWPWAPSSAPVISAIQQTPPAHDCVTLAVPKLLRRFHSSPRYQGPQRNCLNAILSGSIAKRSEEETRKAIEDDVGLRKASTWDQASLPESSCLLFIVAPARSGSRESPSLCWLSRRILPNAYLLSAQDAKKREPRESVGKSCRTINRIARQPDPHARVYWK